MVIGVDFFFSLGFSSFLCLCGRTESLGMMTVLAVTFAFVLTAFAAAALLGTELIQMQHFGHLAGTQIFAEFVIEFGLQIREFFHPVETCLG